MQKLLRIIFLGLLSGMAGCIPSVHPLYTQQDLIFEPALVGEWTDKDGKETWTFTKTAEKEYKLVYVDEEGRKGGFVVHLLKVNDHRFLDLYPVGPELKEKNDFYKGHLFPVHTFARVQEIKPTLRMAIMNPDWIKKFLENDPGAIQHEKVDDAILLTAQATELQTFLIKHEKTPDAWNECNPMTRRSEAVQKTAQ